MKPLFAIITAMCLVMTTSLPAVAEVTIDGPDKIQPASQPQKYTISGATLTDLVQGQAKLIWFPRAGVQVWDAASWTGQPYLLVTAEKPGKILLAVTYAKDRGLVYAEKEVEAAGENPPQPPEPPGPGGKKQLVIVLESNDLDNLPRAQQAIAASLKLRQALEAQGHRFLQVLTPAQAANAPPALAPFFAAVDGHELPRIAIAPINGGPITDYPLPADEAAFWRLVNGGQAP